MSRALRLVTHNAHKVEEIGAILGAAGFVVRGLDDLPPFDVIEDADSFEGNAIKKALAVHAYVQEPALADDSGLVVDALGGAPGIHSARYAGVAGRDADAANRLKLHRALEGVHEPRARFVCVLAYAAPGQAPLLFRGELEGTIIPVDRGTNGFGYDPMFVPLGDSRALAEYSASEKNAISHRAIALAKLGKHFGA
jgi:XTP/dITP diphosphohydrolase